MQVLFLRANNITDDEIKQMALALKPDPAFPGASNKSLKVLDISYNPITEKSLDSLAGLLNSN